VQAAPISDIRMASGDARELDSALIKMLYTA
jgi:hypothetical protein